MQLQSTKYELYGDDYSNILGNAIAKRLVDLESKFNEDLEQVKRDITDTKSPIKFIKCDVSDAKSIASALQRTINEVGIPNIGINCAGIAPAKKIIGKNGGKRWPITSYRFHHSKGVVCLFYQDFPDVCSLIVLRPLLALMKLPKIIPPKIYKMYSLYLFQEKKIMR